MKQIKRTPIERRFWRRVRKSPECWAWLGDPDTRGYGRICAGGRRSIALRAHRFAWQLMVGPIPDGLLVLHHCDNRLCVNPKHLFVGTHADNMRDMVEKGRAKGGNLGRGNPRLTEEQVVAIRALAAAGTTQQDIARQYGISESNTSYIVARRSWKHI